MPLYLPGRYSQSIAPQFQFLMFWSVAIVDFESNKGTELVRAMKLIKLTTLPARCQNPRDMRLCQTDYILIFYNDIFSCVVGLLIIFLLKTSKFNLMKYYRKYNVKLHNKIYIEQNVILSSLEFLIYWMQPVLYIKVNRVLDNWFCIVLIRSQWSSFRSSHLEVFLRKGVLKICSKFTGEHLCRSVISSFLISMEEACF